MQKRKHFAIYSIFGAAWRVLRRVGGKLSRGFIVCLLGVIAFGMLADEMGEGDTGRFDAFVREGVNSFATPVLTNIAIFLSFVGDWPFLTVLGFAIFGYLLCIKWKREAVIFFITNVGELILLRDYAGSSWEEIAAEVDAPSAAAARMMHARALAKLGALLRARGL